MNSLESEFVWISDWIIRITDRNLVGPKKPKFHRPWGTLSLTERVHRACPCSSHYSATTRSAAPNPTAVPETPNNRSQHSRFAAGFEARRAIHDPPELHALRNRRTKALLEWSLWYVAPDGGFPEQLTCPNRITYRFATQDKSTKKYEISCG